MKEEEKLEIKEAVENFYKKNPEFFKALANN